ncbi:hypothetical protein [Quatrionicoccus australiensis]|uniref:hypothetical protein n=1 Tax=Quatrionicoccus australiensis TaxID=138118 RepID=UPI001CFB9210|nr:hypothetical protein [Quatrionicoccus australiensis]MCB4358222.1 hypothetical protein [Quatrionicoccus australiensis]
MHLNALPPRQGIFISAAIFAGHIFSSCRIIPRCLFFAGMNINRRDHHSKDPEVRRRTLVALTLAEKCRPIPADISFARNTTATIN